MIAPPDAPHRLLRTLRRSRLRGAATLLLLASLLLQSVQAVAPGWWGTQQVLLPSATADDYTVANLGQLKNVAKKAATEFNSALTGGAGDDINDLIAAWEAPAAAGVMRDDYAALTLGQLKHVARLFYDRLAEAGVTEAGSYPWSGKDADEYALANLGQLKAVFSFETATGDTNQNGLPDVWEMRYFGNLNQNPGDDFDLDGMSNLAEYLAGTDPASADTDDDGVGDGEEVAHGTDPNQLPPSATWTQAQLAAAAAAYEIGLQQRSRYAYTDVWVYGGWPDEDPETEDDISYDYWTYLDDDFEHEIWTGSCTTNWPDNAEELAEGAQEAHDSVDEADMDSWQPISPAGEDGVAVLSTNGTVEAYAVIDRGVGTAKTEYRLVRRLKAGATAPRDSAGNLIKPEIKRTFLKMTRILPTSSGGAPTPAPVLVPFTIEAGTDISTTTTGVLFPPLTKAGTHSIELMPVEIKDVKGAGIDDDIVIQTASAKINRPTSAQIAFIEPHGGFADSPMMPQIEVSIPGGPANVDVEWSLEVKYDRGNGSLAGRNQPEDTVNVPYAGFVVTKKANEVWRIYEDSWWENTMILNGFFGGHAVINMKMGTTEQQFHFRIGGKNPDNDLARQSLESRQPDLWYAYAICKHETAEYRHGETFYNQFVGNPRGKKLVYTKYKRSFQFSYGDPTWNWDFSDNKPGGYGLFQVTGWQRQTNGNVPRDVIWNWQRNMDEGANEIRRDKVPNATAYFNAVRKKHGANTPNPPTVSTGKSRDLTGFEASVIVRYNGTGGLPSHPELAPWLPYTKDPWTYTGSGWQGPSPNSQNYLNKVLPEFE